MNPIQSANASDEADIEEDDELRLYECAVLYPHTISQKEEQDLFKEIEKTFEDAGSKQVSKDTWGRRGLAYPIKGHTEGRYVIYYYEMDPAKIREVDETLRIMPGVLRHIIVKPPKGYQIIKFSESYEQWNKDQAEEVERAAEEEEKELQKRVAERARRQVKRAEAEKKVEKAPVKEEQITEELEKLISDDELDI